MNAEVVAIAGSQSGVFPAEVDGLRFAEVHGPACEQSGDFVFLTPRSNQFCVVIGDACGRGVPAAHLVELVKPDLIELCGFVDSPAELLSAVNRAIAGKLPDNVFVTAAALFIDTHSGLVHYANAGHVPPILRHAREAHLVAAASGPPLGMVSEVAYRDESFYMQRSDILLMMTDGIVEAVEDDLLTMPNLRALLQNAPRNLREITHTIFSEVTRCASRPDDRTLLGLEFTRRCKLPRSSRLELSPRQAA